METATRDRLEAMRSDVHETTSRIQVIDLEKDKRWDEFVLSHARTSIYHHSAWIKVLSRSYNYKPFLLAWENPETKQLEKILPFLLVASRLTGRRLVSLPFTSYCEQMIAPQHIAPAVSFVSRLCPRIDYVELRWLEARAAVDRADDRPVTYFTHLLSLDADLDLLYGSFHSTSVRQRIKRAERNDLHFRIAEDERDLQKFYALETGVRRKHGIPPHPYRFFANMWRSLGPLGYFSLALIEYKNQAIAAATVLRFKDKVHLEYSASDQNHLALSPNQMLIWEIIKMAHHSGARYFDFGRSAASNRSLIEFKERWGAKAHPLAYYRFPPSQRQITAESLSKKIFYAVNRILPTALLIKEGELLFPHLG